MDCRRRSAVDDDRSRRWVVDDDRYPWAVDEDRCQIRWAVDEDRHRRRCAIKEDRRRRRRAVDCEEDDCSALQLPLPWRDPPPHYPHKDRCQRRRALDDRRRREIVRATQVNASLDRMIDSCSRFIHSLDQKLSSASIPTSSPSLQFPLRWRDPPPDHEKVADYSIEQVSDLQSDLEPEEAATAAVVESHSCDLVPAVEADPANEHIGDSAPIVKHDSAAVDTSPAVGYFPNPSIAPIFCPPEFPNPLDLILVPGIQSDFVVATSPLSPAQIELPLCSSNLDPTIFGKQNDDEDEGKDFRWSPDPGGTGQLPFPLPLSSCDLISSPRAPPEPIGPFSSLTQSTPPPKTTTSNVRPIIPLSLQHVTQSYVAGVQTSILQPDPNFAYVFSHDQTTAHDIPAFHTPNCFSKSLSDFSPSDPAISTPHIYSPFPILMISISDLSDGALVSEASDFEVSLVTLVAMESVITFQFGEDLSSTSAELKLLQSNEVEREIAVAFLSCDEILQDVYKESEDGARRELGVGSCNALSFAPELVSQEEVETIFIEKLSMNDCLRTTQSCLSSQLSSSSRDVFVKTSLVSIYAKCGGLDEAQRMFDKIPKTNVMSCNAMISGCISEGKMKESVAVFQRSLERELKPESLTLLRMLTTCNQLGDVKKRKWVQELLAEENMDINVFAAASLVDRYTTRGRKDKAHCPFDGMVLKDVVVVISGCSSNKLSKKALELFFKMKAMNIKSGQLEAPIKFRTVKEDGVIWKALLSAWRIFDPGGLISPFR